MKLIPSSQGKVAKVSDRDYPFLSRWKWSYSQTSAKLGYAKRRETVDGKQKSIYMHRIIVGRRAMRTNVDHADNDTLNNQRFNLRVCTPSQNQANSRRRNRHGLRGVYRHTNKFWRSRIVVNGQVIELGLYVDRMQAAKAYDRMALKLHGRFARTNFPK